MGDAAFSLCGVDGWTTNGGPGACSEVFTDEDTEKGAHFTPAALDVRPLEKTIKKNVERSWERGRDRK